jgi:hypothetical protein
LGFQRRGKNGVGKQETVAKVNQVPPKVERMNIRIRNGQNDGNHWQDNETHKLKHNGAHRLDHDKLVLEYGILLGPLDRD